MTGLCFAIDAAKFWGYKERRVFHWFMAKHILSVSYDASLLATRQLMLEQAGYEVTSAHGFIHAIAHCKTAIFDLFILGHSIPASDKQELIRTFRSNYPAPVLSLARHGEELVKSDFCVDPFQPLELLEAVAEIFARLTEPSRALDGDTDLEPSTPT